MADTMLALQKALVAALSGLTAPSETTGAVPVGVAFYDHPPDNAPRPLIVLDRHEIDAERDEFDAPEVAHEITLQVVSRYRGTRQAIAIMADITTRLHGIPPPLEVGSCSLLRVESQVVEREPDGTTYTGTITVRAITS